MKCCLRCKRFRARTKVHSAIHIVRNGRVEMTSIKYICEHCERIKGRWSAI